VLLIESSLPIHRIGADSHSGGVEFGELRLQVAETAAFPGSTGGHRPLVEEQDQRSGRNQVVQRHGVAVLVFQAEVADQLTFAQMRPELKDGLSHRARAAQKALPVLHEICSRSL